MVFAVKAFVAWVAGMVAMKLLYALTPKAYHNAVTVTLFVCLVLVFIASWLLARRSRKHRLQTMTDLGYLVQRLESLSDQRTWKRTYTHYDTFTGLDEDVVIEKYRLLGLLRAYLVVHVIRPDNHELPTRVRLFIVYPGDLTVTLSSECELPIDDDSGSLDVAFKSLQFVDELPDVMTAKVESAIETWDWCAQ